MVIFSLPPTIMAGRRKKIVRRQRGRGKVQSRILIAKKKKKKRSGSFLKRILGTSKMLIGLKKKAKGKPKGYLTKVKHMLQGKLKRGLATKKGKAARKKVQDRIVKAGLDIMLKGADPGTTIKRTLKEGGQAIGRAALGRLGSLMKL